MWLFLKNLAFVVFVPGTLAVFLPIYLFGKRGGSLEGTGPIGLVLLIAGACMAVWCMWDFWRTGHGTPAPIDPPKALVVRGLYRYIRNPMYVGVLLVVAGEAILFASWSILVYALCAAAGFHLFVLCYEEPALRRKFGAAYDEYVQRVPRWLPHIRGNGGQV